MSQATVEPEINESTPAGQPSSTGGIAPRRKRLMIWGGGAALTLLLFFGIRYLVWSAHHEETDDAYLEGHLHPISARITDTVQQVLIDDNQHVLEGQTLVVLDPNDYKVNSIRRRRRWMQQDGRQTPPRPLFDRYHNPRQHRQHKQKAPSEKPRRPF